jgi:hypothetical protein
MNLHPSRAETHSEVVVPDHEANTPRCKYSSEWLVRVIVFVLLAGLGFSAYWFGFRDRADGPKLGSAQTEKWETYTSAQNVYKVSFLGKPAAQEVWWLGGVRVNSKISEVIIGEKSVGTPTLTLIAGFARLWDGARPVEVDDVKKQLITQYVAPVGFGMDSGDSRSIQNVTASGREWEEEHLSVGGSSGVIRWHRSGPLLYLIGYRSEHQAAPKDVVEKFFASYEILGGDPGDPDPVKLDGWVQYSPPKNIFRASFPSTPHRQYFYSTSVTDTSSEVYDCFVHDKLGSTIANYFAGYVTFATHTTNQEAKQVTEWVARQFGVYGVMEAAAKHITINGRTWEERQLELGDPPFWRGGALFRWVEIGPTIYIVGIKNYKRFPPDKEVEKFFGSFEIIAPTKTP